jgi:hypothetical protein
MYGFTREFWRRLLPLIPRWHALTLPQRVAALGMPHGFHDPLHAFRSLSADLDAFCFDTDRLGQKRATPDFQFLAAFVKRLAAWSKPGGAELRAYVQATTTMAQRNAMTGMRPGYNSEYATQAFVKRFKEGAFGRALAASESPAPFIRAAGGWVPGGEDFGTAEFRLLRDWFLQATRKGDAAYILDAGAFEDPKGALEPAALLNLAVGFGLAIVFRRESELLPCFAVAAPKGAADHRPENLVMKAVPAADPFWRPFVLDDIEAWLRILKNQPAPVLSDGCNVPLAHQRKVAKAFIPLPSWLPERGFEAEDRAGAALWLILRMELAASLGNKRKDWRLGVGPKGEAWLASSREEKMAAVLKAAPLSAAPPGKRGTPSHYETFAYLGDFAANPFPYSAATPLLFEWLVHAFTVLPGPVDWREFWKSAADKANPFVMDADRDPELDGRWAAWEESPETVYANLMHRCAGRLAGLGAIGFAEAEGGRIAVLPTPVGEWLFGRAEKWTLPQGRKGVAVVGADFTVALLEKSPEAQVELSAFAEGEGNAFRITKKSVQAAAHAGRTAESILAALAGLAKHAVPANVAHEIREWAGAKKTVRAEETLLIEGDDPVVLAEIRAAFPKDFAPVGTGTAALKYLGKGKREAVLRRLAKKGFFCG